MKNWEKKLLKKLDAISTEIPNNGWRLCRKKLGKRLIFYLVPIRPKVVRISQSELSISPEIGNWENTWESAR